VPEKDAESIGKDISPRLKETNPHHLFEITDQSDSQQLVNYFS